MDQENRDIPNVPDAPAESVVVPPVYKSSPEAIQRLRHSDMVLGRLLAQLGDSKESFKGLDGKAIDGKVRELLDSAGVRSSDDKLAAISEKLEMGGVVVEIKPLPAAKAMKWRRDLIDRQRQLGQREINTPIDQYDYANDVAQARLDTFADFAKMAGFEIPENATDHDIAKGIGIAEMLNFPLDAITEVKNPPGN